MQNTLPARHVRKELCPVLSQVLFEQSASTWVTGTPLFNGSRKQNRTSILKSSVNATVTISKTGPNFSTVFTIRGTLRVASCPEDKVGSITGT